MVKARDYHAEELGSDPTPDKLTECELLFREESKALVPR